MTLYRNMTTPQLARHGLHWKSNSPHERRMIYALAARLEQEYERANRHLEKSIEAARYRVKLEPAVGYIKVAKPHISLCSATWFDHGYPTHAGDKQVWRCEGPWRVVQYGLSPALAYQSWRRVMEQGPVQIRRD